MKQKTARDCLKAFQENAIVEEGIRKFIRGNIDVKEVLEFAIKRTKEVYQIQ